MAREHYEDVVVDTIETLKMNLLVDCLQYEGAKVTTLNPRKGLMREATKAATAAGTFEVPNPLPPATFYALNPNTEILTRADHT